MQRLFCCPLSRSAAMIPQDRVSHETTSTTGETHVEILKTNVNHQEKAERLIAKLETLSLDLEFNFDLEDSDRILRIAGPYDWTGMMPGILRVLRHEGIRSEIIE